MKKKYKYWAIGIIISMLLMAIDSKYRINPNRTVIYVKAPELMQEAFEETLSNVRLNKNYKLEFIENSNKANFIITEGKNAKGEIIAYSPIIAVFNSDEKLYKNFQKKGYFIESDVDTIEYDFDFKKVIDNIVKGEETELKIYYPSKDSNIWEEFYNFLLFTVNDGYYPKNSEDMEKATKRIDEFLNTKNFEMMNDSMLQRSNGFAKNSIYFMTYTDLGNLYNSSGKLSCRIMYPTSVVYHNYYVDFDETGKILYEALDENGKGLLGVINCGYYNLVHKYYYTKYFSYTVDIGESVLGERDKFNGVEIPQ